MWCYRIHNFYAFANLFAILLSDKILQLSISQHTPIHQPRPKLDIGYIDNSADVTCVVLKIIKTHYKIFHNELSMSGLEIKHA